MELDGADDYASAPDHPSLDLGTEGDFTIEAYIYIDNAERNDSDVVVWKTGAYGLSILYATDELQDRIVFRVNTSATETSQIFYNLYLSKGWHHIAAVFDDEFSTNEDLLAIFLDGNRVVTFTDFDATAIPNSSSSITIGANAGANPVRGWLEELRLSDTVRYAGTTYAKPIAPFNLDEHTCALWHFNEAWDISIFQDSTTNGNTLTGIDGAQIGNPTGIIPIALPFDKISPANQITEASTTTELTWESSIGASGYQVCIETDDNDICDHGWFDIGLNTSFAPILDAYTQYRWQVRSINLVSTIYANDGIWWSFKTEDLPQSGPEYDVTISVDEFDGLCGIKHCTLREAMAAAATDNIESTLVLKEKTLYVVRSSSADPVHGNSAFPAIKESLTIEGHGAIIERDPSLVCRTNAEEDTGEFRLLHIADSVELTLNQVTLRNGCSDRNPTIQTESGFGGAIFNQGILTLVQTTLASNQAYQGGGAIMNITTATLNLDRSTVMNNFAVLDGGGLLNAGIANLTNCTVTGNITAGNGGGLNNLSTGFLRLNFVTIAENSAGANGGGIANSSETNLMQQNSILANNIDINFGTPDCIGNITSLGYNLVEDPAGCNFLGLATDLETDIVNEDPWLISLADGGGFTLTHALWVLSPAIDQIPYGENGCGSIVANDQRDVERPLDADLDGQVTCDIGAVEMREGSAILKYVYFSIISK